jgi:hypothetical protein
MPVEHERGNVCLGFEAGEAVAQELDLLGRHDFRFRKRGACSARANHSGVAWALTVPRLSELDFLPYTTLVPCGLGVRVDGKWLMARHPCLP